MASQEQITCSLPDTQNADALTQSQEALSQEPTLVVWGRLCPKHASLRSLGRNCISLQIEIIYPIIKCINIKRNAMSYFTELVRESYTLGRSTSCDITLTSNELQPKILGVISKKHFRIIRECINNSNEFVVYLEDMSHNGTFVDRIRVGRGNRVIITNNSEIAVAQEKFSSNYFLYPNLLYKTYR